MAANEIRVGDIGTVFEVSLVDDGVAVDLTGITVKNLIFKKPDGTVVTKIGTVYGVPANGVLRYTTLTGDLDKDGCWQIQAQITLPGGSWKSDIGVFEVHSNLS
jgi:hypothetical protein